MIYEQPLRAVNPMALAMNTGITKIRRFAAPTPPVVRPFLLTDQLRGCCASCSMSGLPPDYGRLRGMGQAYVGDPGTTVTSPLDVPSAGSGNISVLNTVASGANFIPGVGTIASFSIQSLTQFVAKLEAWLHIGAGRREADLIVPVQNQMMSILGGVTNQILMGMSPSLSTLDQLYRQVWTVAVGFQEFVLLRQFTDRRASGQALNTVMPYIDGTCGYPVPAGYTASPGQFNCLSWGDGTIGGVAQNGMLGAIGRAMLAAGGSLPNLQDVHVTANTGIHPIALTPGAGGVIGSGIFAGLPATVMGISTPTALLIGVAALFMYHKGSL